MGGAWGVIVSVDSMASESVSESVSVSAVVGSSGAAGATGTHNEMPADNVSVRAMLLTRAKMPVSTPCAVAIVNQVSPSFTV